MDELLVLPEGGQKTLFAAFQDNVQKKGSQPLLGTQVNGKYEWMTIQETNKAARNFAAGVRKLDLAPEVEGEGTKWRFIGIQSKNRKEWGIAHLANMFIKTTTIALYDTLGPDALKYVINQTEMTTIVCQGDLIKSLIKLKLDDSKLPEPKIA